MRDEILRKDLAEWEMEAKKKAETLKAIAKLAVDPRVQLKPELLVEAAPSYTNSGEPIQLATLSFHVLPEMHPLGEEWEIKPGTVWIAGELK